MRLTLATRGSQLALWQARTTRARLLDSGAASDVQLLEVHSSGDRDRVTSLARFGRIGIFTVEVDTAVVERRADVGVHSLKDTTTTLLDGVTLAAVLPRGMVEDVLLGPHGAPLALADLPPGARIATGSLRRRAMAAAQRPDVTFVELRGNIDTRLAKLDAGKADAMLLARAGLVRLGLDGRIGEVLDVDRFLPAVGQGIVGLTCRTGDDATYAVLESINDADAWAAALAERAVLRALRGGCNVPVGAHAAVADGQVHVRARVLSLDGRERVEGEARGPLADADDLGRELAQDLIARGAERLVAEARA